jgi:hypothetical protein
MRIMLKILKTSYYSNGWINLKIESLKPLTHVDTHMITKVFLCLNNYSSSLIYLILRNTNINAQKVKKQNM